MSEIKLNLARKWRSKGFGEIVGQELTVRMLKNSLYLGHYFPVYLFSGQRGCGKTSMARIFAAAINCAQLEQFRKQPQTQAVPCHECVSCRAMQAGTHPDFIEIDAASHTGVDNVRAVIESSSLLPLMGSKKIYLIDEAHMLSKAAFNAFLKILEEPPASVLYILATTEAPKIIDTVRSRCFQLLFKPIADEQLVKHLSVVCEHEKIKAEKEGLQLIVRESGGSVRDALNMLEQVRFSTGVVSLQAVRDVLGYPDDAQLITLLACALEQGGIQIVQQIQQMQIERFCADYVWQRLLALMRAMIWSVCGVPCEQFRDYQSMIDAVARNQSLERLAQLLQSMYEREQLFMRSSLHHALIEMVLLDFAKKKGSMHEGGSGGGMQSTPLIQQNSPLNASFQEMHEGLVSTSDAHQHTERSEQELRERWQLCLARAQQEIDAHIISVLRQVSIITLPADQILRLTFPKNLSFFEDDVRMVQPHLMPFVHKFFGAVQAVALAFDMVPTPRETVDKQPERVAAPSAVQPASRVVSTARPAFAQKASSKKNTFDISDAQRWQKAHLLLTYFPGAVTEVREVAS